jgi:hypothetical protein
MSPNQGDTRKTIGAKRLCLRAGLPSDQLGAVARTDLHQRRAHVAFHGPLAEVEAAGDLVVGQTLNDEVGDLTLPGAERVVGGDGRGEPGDQRLGTGQVPRQVEGAAWRA